MGIGEGTGPPHYRLTRLDFERINRGPEDFEEAAPARHARYREKQARSSARRRNAACATRSCRTTAPTRSGCELLDATRPTRQHLAGSLPFGIGWAFSGTCPGPVAAQLGRGQLVALFTVAGIFAGVAVFGYLKRRRDSAAASPAKAELFGAAPGL